jgi:hypothetical protein
LQLAEAVEAAVDELLLLLTPEAEAVEAAVAHTLQLSLALEI